MTRYWLKDRLKQWAEWVGVGLFALAALIYALPATIGFVYPFVALPLYGMSCLPTSSTPDKAWVPFVERIDAESYSLLLRNQGCDIEEALRIQKEREQQLERQCRERIGSTAFDSLKQHPYGEHATGLYCGGYQHFWGEDWLSRGFASAGDWIGGAMARSFMVGLDLGVTTFTDLYNANIVVRALLVAAYLLISAFAMTMLAHLATDTYHWLRKQMLQVRRPGSDDGA